MIKNHKFHLVPETKAANKNEGEILMLSAKGSNDFFEGNRFNGNNLYKIWIWPVLTAFRTGISHPAATMGGGAKINAYLQLDN